MPLSTWDHDTLRAVALAYRHYRRLGARDLPARNAAEAAYYLGRHPSTPRTDAQHTVALTIAAGARDDPEWLWKGAGDAS